VNLTKQALRASELTAREAGIEVPVITGELLDAYDDELMNINNYPQIRERNDDAKQNRIAEIKREYFQDIVVLKEALPDKNIVTEQLSPLARFHENSILRTETKASLTERMENFPQAEPEYTEAFREHLDQLPYPKTLDDDKLFLFLFPARIYHDVYAKHYELESLQSATGLE